MKKYLYLFLLMASPALAQIIHPVAYITDIEGKWKKVVDFVNANPLVRLEEAANGRDPKLYLADGAYFIFGGDSIDTGPDSRKVVRVLNDFKRRYPDRVILIAGNRDINKIALDAILSPEALKKTPEEYLNWLEGKTPTRENRLQWYFAKRMGAAKAFAFQKDELSRERGHEVSDAEVVDSYLSSLAAGGDLYEYLHHAQLAFQMDGVLYIHGALTQENYGWVPGMPEGHRILSCPDWVQNLNAFYAQQIAAWSSDRSKGETLLNYQRPLKGTQANSFSVVYARYSDATGNAHIFPPEVMDWLAKNGVYLVVSGHTPQGDLPTLMEADGFRAIVADNTFADHANALFIRGQDVTIKSWFKNGAPTAERVEFDWKRADGSPLGRRVQGSQELVVGRLSGGRWLLFQVELGDKAKKDFKPRQRVVTDEELKSLPLHEPRSCELPLSVHSSSRPTVKI